MVCPGCEASVWCDVTLELKIEKDVTDTDIYKYTLENINIEDVVTEDIFTRSIIEVVSKCVCDGFQVTELRTILKEKCGIAEMNIDEIIELVENGLKMYSPDMKTLYFL